MTTQERARAVVDYWPRGRCLDDAEAAELEARIAAAIETAVAAERAECAAAARHHAAHAARDGETAAGAGLDRRAAQHWAVAAAAETIAQAIEATDRLEAEIAAERARCVALARDWLPGDVLAELEGENG